MAEDFQPKFVDLVRNFTTVQGTGPVSLGAAVSGHTGFAQATAAGDRFYYCIQGVDKPAEREVGRGTMQANGTISREPISGSLTHFSSGSKTIALVTAAEWFSKVGQGGGAAFECASRTALASRQPRNAALLIEPRREGLFLFDDSDLSAFVAADTLQGMYVAPASDPTGASGAWVRQGDVLTPFMFGAETNYATGNRGTMSPPYGESAAPGSIDGVLVDSRAACQAVFDMVKLHENRQLVADFSGGIWGIADRGDGIGLYIQQPDWHPRRFIGGHFRGIGSGTYLIYIKAAGYSRFAGEWHIRSGPDGGSSYGYASRQWETGIWIRNSGMARFETIKVSGFKRWGIETDPEFDLADYNNNIGLRFERVYANNNGSAVGRSAGGLEFSIGFTASVRTGSAGSVSQRTDLTLASGHEILRVGDIIRDAAGDYHVIAEKAGAVISVYPWLISTAATGTIYSSHGGAMRVTGKDVAGAGADSLTSVGCGVALDVTNALHGTSWGDVIQEGGGIGTLCGTLNGVNLGHSIGHMHSEGVQLDLLSVGSNNVELLIGACSAWAAQDYADAFKLVDVLVANDGVSRGTAGLPQVAIFLQGRWLQSGGTLGNDIVSTKSRAYAPILSNNPAADRIRKVQAPGAPTNVTLKYYEGYDRCLRDSFVARLEVCSPGGAAPAEEIRITLDAADEAAGVTINGGTEPFVVPPGAASGPVVLDLWLDTNGANRDWLVLPRSGLPIANLSLDGMLTVGTTKKFQAFESGSLLYLRAGDPAASAANGVLHVQGCNGHELAAKRTYAQNHEFYTYGVLRQYLHYGGVALSGAVTVEGTLGYAGTGTGGVVSQSGGKSAAVTLDRACGQITMDGAELAAGASASFVLTNSRIAPSDTLIVNIAAAASVNAYAVTVTEVGAGSCRIQLRNVSGGPLSEAVKLNFAILKAVAA